LLNININMEFVILRPYFKVGYPPSMG